MQLLVRFCNVCGLAPVRMVCDRLTGNFKRFDRHWRHPVNWWFTFLLTGYLGFFILFSSFLGPTYFKEIGQLLTKVEIVASLFYIVNLSFITLIPRLIVIHFLHLETAFECLNRVDRILNKMPKFTPCTTRQRTLFGLSITICAVFISLTN